MKNIKWFKYKKTHNFEKFLNDYGYILDDVEGFSFDGTKRYNGNILKVYSIWFKDYNVEYFTVVSFKSFNECSRCRLGLNGDKLMKLYKDANVVEYKVKDIWGVKDYSVIEN